MQLRRAAALLLPLVFAPPVPAQLGQTVEQPTDYAAIIRQSIGLTTADLFRGVCRDNQGNTYVGVRANGQWVVARLDSVPRVTGVSVAPWEFGDLTYDLHRNYVWASRAGSSDLQPVDLATGLFTGVSVTGGSSPQFGLAYDRSDGLYVLSDNGGLSADQIYRVDLITGQRTRLSNLIPGQSFRHALFNSVDTALWICPDSEFVIAMDPGTFLRTGAITPVDQSIPNNGGTRAGLDIWQNPATGEWLAIVMRTDGSAAWVYSARMQSNAGAGCLGATFHAYPTALRDQLAATYEGPGSLVWLMVAFAPGAPVVPQLSAACQVHLNPPGAIILDPVFIDPVTGRANVSDTIPIRPAILRDLPIWCQFASAGFSGLAVSDARVIAVKQ